MRLSNQLPVDRVVGDAKLRLFLVFLALVCLVAFTAAPASAATKDLGIDGCSARAHTGQESDLGVEFAFNETHDLNSGCATLRTTLYYSTGGHVYASTAQYNAGLVSVVKYYVQHEDATNGAADVEYGHWDTIYRWA